MVSAAQPVQPSDVQPDAMGALPEGAPTVAVVVSLNFPNMTAEVNELVIRFTKSALQSLTDAGARVVLVDSSLSPLPPVQLVHGADGVLFLGGGDVDPTLYGVLDSVPNLYGVDQAADLYCIDLITTAVTSDSPLLAICRGSQLLNLALGGDLIPDLHSWDLHRGGPGLPMFLDEDVTITPGTRLHDILQRDRVTVRSGHHQAAGVIAPSLRVAARADDGIVEATEHVDATWVIGVQWHPEDTEGNADDRRKLISAFVDRVVVSRELRSQHRDQS